MFKGGDPNSICTIDNFLVEDNKLLEDNLFNILIDNNISCEHHPNRYRYLIKRDNKIYSSFESSIRKEIINRWNDLSELIISDIYLCKDVVPFKCIVHSDDYYKYVSCILYMNNGEGTTFYCGINKTIYIEAKKNRLLFFKSKDLFHSVKESNDIRYTLQFHFRLKNVEYYDIIGCNINILSSIKVEKTIHFIHINHYKLLSSNRRIIHMNIDPDFKCSDIYKQYFFNKNKKFIGISRNFMYDANNDKCNTNKMRDKYVMISKHSLNQKHKTYFETKKGKFNEILEQEKEIFKEWWSDDYKLEQKKDKIVIFVQNYSKTEYWFGWEDNDIEEWIMREIRFFNLITSKTRKTILIKFHPKMKQEYVDFYKNRINNKDIVFYHTIGLKDIFDMVDCCFINSGSSAILSMMYGIPTFYVDDSYSSIPVNKIACKDINQIDKIDKEILPDRKICLDFIFSQIFSLRELERYNINEFFSD
jgi:hypothetical protein